MIELSQAVAGKHLDLEGLAKLDDGNALDQLTALRGVGRWTAQYALLRGLGRLHIFPGDDGGARNALQRWLRLKNPLSYDDVIRLLAKWQPYGGLIYFHMLLHGLHANGHLRAATS
ncbi:MAG: DNA-3-methyladenine glycosylase family protein [Terriglobia bacterium]